jgi:hypothetical protein
MLGVHGAQLPWGEMMAEDIPVLVAERVTTMLRALPPLLNEAHVALLTEQAYHQLRPAS